MIDAHIEGPELGIFGEPVVNVLLVNLDLDRLDNRSTEKWVFFYERREAKMTNKNFDKLIAVALEARAAHRSRAREAGAGRRAVRLRRFQLAQRQQPPDRVSARRQSISPASSRLDTNYVYDFAQSRRSHDRRGRPTRADPAGVSGRAARESAATSITTT